MQPPRRDSIRNPAPLAAQPSFAQTNTARNADWHRRPQVPFVEYDPAFTARNSGSTISTALSRRLPQNSFNSTGAPAATPKRRAAES